MYKERKTAQIAAYFLLRRGGTMSHLKLMKLLYLADREAMEKYSFPLTGDKFVAMPHGPVLSLTLNLMDGDTKPSRDGWDCWISDIANNELSLKTFQITLEDLDELSKADLEVLDSVWEKFGKMDRWEIRDYTHIHCPEWEDPNGSSLPISKRKVFLALGHPATEALALEGQIDSEEFVDHFFASL